MADDTRSGRLTRRTVLRTTVAGIAFAGGVETASADTAERDAGTTAVDRPPRIREYDGDGDAFTGGQTDRIDLHVTGNADVSIRDRFPAEWTVVEGDPHATYVDDDTRFVEFTNDLEDGTRTYFAEAPETLTETRSYEFGPIEYSLDGGDNWIEISDTTDRNNVLAADTEL